jgi:hypothetical protein
MAENFVRQSISSPGFLGLNSQTSSEDADIRFASTVENIVFDSAGRLAARKGWLPVTEQLGQIGETGIAEWAVAEFGVSEFGSVNTAKFVAEFVKDDDNIIISGSGNSLYTGTTTLSQETIMDETNENPATYTITNDNWQYASIPYGETTSMKPHGYLVQAGHPMLVFHELPEPGSANPHAHDSGEFGFQVLGDIGTVPPNLLTSTFTPNCALAAYGRIWVADLDSDRQTVYFSRLLDGSDFAGGDSGYLSINSVFPNNDKIVGLAAHNGFLIIFGTNNIAIYANPIDVTQLTLQDYIPNVGCISRDTIQSTGTDIIFLSNNGLLSLTRIIQEKSLPFRDLSANIRDEFLNDIAAENTEDIKSTYSARNAFYLLTLPSRNTVYCFDTRVQLENGAYRVTTWRGNIDTAGNSSFTPYAFCVTENNDVLFGLNAYIGKYIGYTDNNNNYTFKYYTTYSNLGAPGTIKILKKLAYYIRGEENKQLYPAWAFDFKDDITKTTKSFTSTAVSEYGIAEYSLGEFGGGGQYSENFTINATGAGRVIKVGLEADINGNYLALQKIDLYAKQGKEV